MLRYEESNWLCEEGLELKNYQVSFDNIRPETTVEEQKKRAERLSLVRFFDTNKQDDLFEICDQLWKNNKHFYYNKSKKFHITLLGFPVIDPVKYGLVREKIKEFCNGMQWKTNLKLDLIRLGTMFEEGSSLNPVPGLSNGTVIGYGGILPNKEFVAFGNELCSFLLKDRVLQSILGRNFRRRFPTVWCTMGFYTRGFKITGKLEDLFNEYLHFESSYFESPCRELELGKSCYKDLRDWKTIRKFHI
jgi:hypothetical protein